jgi:hypothetical protein
MHFNVKPIALLFLLFCSLAASAQNETDTLRFDIGFFRNSFFKGNELINQEQFEGFLNTNTESQRLLDQADWLGFFADGAGIMSGAFIGAAVGRSISNGEFAVTPFSIGLAFAALAVPFDIAANRKLRRASYIYNAGLRQTSREKIQFQMGFSNTGIGIQLRF